MWHGDLYKLYLARELQIVLNSFNYTVFSIYSEW